MLITKLKGEPIGCNEPYELKTWDVFVGMQIDTRGFIDKEIIP
jgi:hypothetical protein